MGRFFTKTLSMTTPWMPLSKGLAPVTERDLKELADLLAALPDAVPEKKGLLARFNRLLQAFASSKVDGVEGRMAPTRTVTAKPASAKARPSTARRPSPEIGFEDRMEAISASYGLIHQRPMPPKLETVADEDFQRRTARLVREWDADAA